MSVDNVEDITPRVQYVALAAQTDFDYPFPIFEDGDLVVIVDGVTKALGTDYTVTGEGEDTGGTVTFLVAMTGDEIVTIYRDIPIERTTDFQTNGPLRSSTFNDELDRVTMIMQQLEANNGRALRLPVASEATSADAELSPIANWLGKYVTINSAGVPEPATIVTGTISQSVIGDLLFPQTQAEDDAGVTPTSTAYPELNLRRYGGAPGAGDNTVAMNRAEAVCAEYGGGVIDFDTVGDWRMNWVCTTKGVVLRGRGGLAEFDQTCIRPFSLTSAPVTFGDGTTDVRYCGTDNIHISGTDGSTGSDAQSAKSAPHALRLRGGCINFHAHRSAFYNGIKTISLEPSATQPVSGCTFEQCVARNDLTDSADARTIYGIRLADPGFFTDNKFINTKLNGPTLGYFAEFDGTAVAMTAEFTDCYVDHKPGKGVLLKGASELVCHNLQLDPGTTGAVIIETDQAQSDPARFIHGYLRHGGQKVQFSGAVTIDLPAEADSFSYQQRLQNAYHGVSTYFALATDPYSTDVELALGGAAGPLSLSGADFHVKKDIHVWGGNGAAAGQISAVSANGGLFLAALGTNQNVRLVPSGTGNTVVQGTALQPNADNATTCGSASNRWSTVYAATGAINTSDERAKQDIEEIPQTWLDAWGEVQWSRYRFKDAVEKKGAAARWHVGLVAQRVVEAFANHGIDALAIGLVCYDEWEGGSRYGIRYEEAFALEAAYVRRRLDG